MLQKVWLYMRKKESGSVLQKVWLYMRKRVEEYVGGVLQKVWLYNYERESRNMEVCCRRCGYT